MAEQQKPVRFIDQTSTIPMRKRTIIVTGGSVLAMLIAVYSYIEATILSQPGVLFSLYIPSRSGSGDIYMNSITGVFVAAAIIAGALLGLAWWLIRKKEWLSSTVITIGLAGGWYLFLRQIVKQVKQSDGH